MIVAFTGHRPPKAGLSWSHQGPGDQLAVHSVRHWLQIARPDLGIVGGALGFDTLAARALWLEKIPYKVFVPFTGQEDRWPDHAKERYYRMLDAAEDVHYVSQGEYRAEKMQRRNEEMVDLADYLVAWWDGSKGGTGNCVRYAESKYVGLPVHNLYADLIEGETTLF